MPNDALEATRVLTVHQERARAADMRRIVHEQPRNAVRWVDLALAHTNLGELERAAKDMKVAVQLAPDSRFVLRSAARLHTVLARPDVAQDLLRRSDALRSDPWLQAAEISLAEVTGRRSSIIKTAKRLVQESGLPPIHLSELATELATAELRSGSIRDAKRFLRIGMVEPTENAIAQAGWAAQHGGSSVGELAVRDPRSFEARSRLYESEGMFAEAVVEALKWQADQPFDAKAGIHVSYMASVALDRHDLSEQAARRALRANPRHALLRNNLIFALASQNKLDEAEAELKVVRSMGLAHENPFSLRATEGLIHFRRRRPDEARQAYAEAIRGLDKPDSRSSANLARLFLAREEILFGSDHGRAILQTVMTTKMTEYPEASVLIDRLHAMLEDPGVLDS